jgi:PadR family transcriptional regulator, regulatory protein PadR
MLKNPMLTFAGTEMLILSLLADKPSMYGLELVETSSGRLKRGTVYVTLGRMEDKGYVESEQEPPRPGAIGLPRRLYRLTPRGLRVLEAWAAARATLSWETR